MSKPGLRERHSLAVVAIGARALGYRPASDRNYDLRAEILRLARRWRRYGAPGLSKRRLVDGYNIPSRGRCRAIRCVGIVHDATHECVARVPGRSMSDTHDARTRWLALTRGLPKIIRSDNDSEFLCKAILK